MATTRRGDGKKSKDSATTPDVDRGFAPPQDVPASMRLRYISSAETGHELQLSKREWLLISKQLSLSTRESQITRLLLNGTNDADIASQLTIAQRTVPAHLERLYKKLGIHSRQELIVRIFAAYLFCVKPASVSDST